MDVSSSYQEGVISTVRGPVRYRHYPCPVALSGVIWVGGIGGFWDGPAGNLYARLSEALVKEGMTSLRINVRCPTDLNESVADTLAAIAFLQDLQVDHLGLVGHALAGAVAIRAAVYSGRPETVVALAAQSQGAELVGQLSSDCSLLLIHGTADEVLHVSNSEYLAALAHQPKELLLCEGARHGLEEAAPAVHQHVGQWLRRNLRRPDQQAFSAAS
jgi:alpha/beta superfamily hydrolase